MARKRIPDDVPVSRLPDIFLLPETALEQATLDDLLDKVVRPVAESILNPGELEEAVVDVTQQIGSDVTVIAARLWACGEYWTLTIWEPDLPIRTYKEIAADVAGSLQDWVAESKFGWGQWREVR